jgi:hypothetical protein
MFDSTFASKVTGNSVTPEDLQKCLLGRSSVGRWCAVSRTAQTAPISPFNCSNQRHSFRFVHTLDKFHLHVPVLGYHRQEEQHASVVVNI